jgi:hypothetical protein|tara:strand:+ start:780 stop:1103 length:324 start_codon:yes stop_codon:yes gene_type:complete
MDNDYNYTTLELQVILERYQKQKEYRRVYYKNKYHSDEKYKQYCKDYNKERYENQTFETLMSQQHCKYSKEEIELRRANNLHKYYLKTNRLEIFYEKYPLETLLIDL